ncbi:MAG: tetratricopeptide repeat protein [Halomonas sp.]|nr:tetratricopeptide repeat protein [Halomonas sp.]
MAQVSRCDELAAHPKDPARTNSGVSMERMLLPQALEACSNAMTQNPIPRIKYQYARTLSKQGHYKEALQHFKDAASEGYSMAYFNIAHAYLFGDGVPVDHKKSFYWFMKAAKEGIANAQNEVGLFYFTGGVIGKNFNKAKFWFEKAALQDEPLALRNLGIMYSEGMGVRRNSSQAFKYWLRAANLGDADSQYNVALFYTKGIAVRLNWKRAETWYKKAIAQGHRRAMYNLALLYDSLLFQPVKATQMLKYLANSSGPMKYEARRELKNKQSRSRTPLPSGPKNTGFCEGWMALDPNC